MVSKNKTIYTDKQIEFQHINYDLVSEEEQNKIMQDVKKLGGGNAFPFVRIGKAVIGHNPEKFLTLLESIE